MLRNYLIFLFLLFGLLFAFDKNTDSLALNFKAETYFKNNEYATTEGYTLTGYNLFPSIEYKYKNRAKITLGTFLLSYSGSDKFAKTSPFLGMEVKLGDNFSASLGNFSPDGKQIAPLSEKEKDFEDFSKSGVKFKFDNSIGKIELWLDWQEFIFPASAKQEKFAVGYSGKSKLIGNLYFPFQGVITHQGGEIDSAKIVINDSLQDAPIQSIFSLAQGLGYSFGDYFDLEGYYLRFSEATSVKRLKASEGNGVYLLGNFHYQNTKIVLSYFYADNFYCSQGSRLFWTTTEADNKNEYLQNISLFYNYNLAISDKIDFQFCLDNVYNLKNKELNYSYSLKICADLEMLRLF